MDKYSKINIYKEYKEYYELLIENQILPNGKAPSSFTPEYIDNMIKFKNRYSNLTIPNINMILKEKKYYDDIPSYPDLEKIKNQTANMLHLLQTNNSSFKSCLYKTAPQEQFSHNFPSGPILTRNKFFILGLKRLNFSVIQFIF